MALRAARLVRRASALLACAALAACTGPIVTQPRPTAVPTSAVPSAGPVGRGCNDTVINAPPAPGAGRALAANPWVELGVPGNAVVAYFFSPRSPFLTAGASLPPTVSNKILWVEEDPTGGDLLIVANPSGATKPSVQLTVPPAGSPRGTYPSIVSLPTPGCWHLAVTWASGRGSIDLVVGAP
jgi:hypothetical protein